VPIGPLSTSPCRTTAAGSAKRRCAALEWRGVFPTLVTNRSHNSAIRLHGRSGTGAIISHFGVISRPNNRERSSACTCSVSRITLIPQPPTSLQCSCHPTFMANSEPSRNARVLRNAPVCRAFSPKITHSFTRRPLKWHVSVAQQLTKRRGERSDE
jgi:hypothetical protein